MLSKLAGRSGTGNTESRSDYRIILALCFGFRLDGWGFNLDQEGRLTEI